MRLLAVGDRQPEWVDAAVGAYTSRFPRDWRFRIDALATARRGKARGADAAVSDEGGRLLDRLASGERLVLLDERGRALTTRQFCEQLTTWQADGRDLCFIIGGPDGVAPPVRERAEFCLSLSALTLPHGLARVLLCEQLYRAWSLSTGHPYHRE